MFFYSFFLEPQLPEYYSFLFVCLFLQCYITKQNKTHWLHLFRSLVIRHVFCIAVNPFNILFGMFLSSNFKMI